MPDDMKSHARILVSSLSDQLDTEFCKILRSEGYKVTQSDDTPHLKKILNQESFNIIFMDHTPNDNESDLLAYIKRRFPSTIVIIVSTNDGFEQAISCIRQGAYDYLIPPVDKSRLLSVVERCLDRQRTGLRSKEMTRSLEEKVIHLQQLNQRMAALYKIMRDTRGLPTIEDSIRKVLEYLGEAIDLECSFCILLDEQCEKRVLQLMHGREADLSRQIFEALANPSDGLRKSFIKGNSLNDVSLETEQDLLRKGIHPDDFRHFIISPLIILKNLFGYLCLVNPRRTAYTFADRQMLSIVASQTVAICEENHSLMQSSQLITMGNLTCELAHDLKNPLSNIKGILQTLEGKWGNDAVRDEAIQMVQEELTRADNLAAELLSFAKTQELEISYCNVHNLLRKSLMITNNTLAKAQVATEEKLHGEPLMVWANENELIDAFVNIVVNAAQAMPDGGTLTIASRLSFHQGFTLRGSPTRGRYVQVEFTDTGLGMTRWELDRIFERFYTTKPSGTGLGLSIVDRIIKKYQGFIDVKSEKDHGTSFYINIPQR